MRSTTEVRFWSKVNKDGPVLRIELGPCWNWTAGCFKDGYGGIGIGPRKTRKMLRAHRFSYELAFGGISDGVMVLHSCDNPKCVNPAHLFLGTAKDNGSDMARKDRSTHGSKSTKAKTTESTVSAMHAAYSNGRRTIKSIAVQFDMPKSTTHAILAGINWRRMKDPSNMKIDPTADGLKL